MVYVTPPSRSDGEVIDQSDWNQDIRANMQAMAPDVFTAKGQLFVATAADVGAALAAPADGKVLKGRTSEAAGMAWEDDNGGGMPNIAIASFGPHACGHYIAPGLVVAAPTSAAWPAANLGLAVSIEVPRPVVVTHGFVMNGASVTGNVDISIYDASFAELASTGATGHTGNNALQTIALSYTLQAATPYYMAISFSSGSTTVYRQAVSSQILRMAGCFEMTSAHPLPSTFVPAALNTTLGSYLPYFGLSARQLL